MIRSSLSHFAGVENDSVSRILGSCVLADIAREAASVGVRVRVRVRRRAVLRREVMRSEVMDGARGRCMQSG